jgi:sulfur dioxygenase
MFFKQLFHKETSTYTYLIADEETKECLLIDPVKEDVDSYLKQIKELGFNLKYVLDTHVHADHITGSGELHLKTGCETVLYEGANVKCISCPVVDGQELDLGSIKVKAIHTPGHTDHHLSYLIKNMIFTGDALLIGGCGRTDFQSGSAKDLWVSLTEKLFKLPDDTLVYPAHDYHNKHVSTILQEKQTNPRLKDQTRDGFVELMDNLNLPDPKYIKIAVPANEKCGL